MKPELGALAPMRSQLGTMQNVEELVVGGRLRVQARGVTGTGRSPVWRQIGVPLTKRTSRVYSCLFWSNLSGHAAYGCARLRWCVMMYGEVTGFVVPLHGTSPASWQSTSAQCQHLGTHEIRHAARRHSIRLGGRMPRWNSYLLPWAACMPDCLIGAPWGEGTPKMAYPSP